jgi:NAD(P)-dependent dehydrogenase (short-subunit alcohol dehydrogenase family)
MDSVDGRVAVITGAGSGIGRATALSLARRGARVVVSDISADRAEVVAAEVEAVGPRGLAGRCDVSDSAQVEALREATFDEFGRIDIVMSNVGIIVKGLPFDIPLEAWSEILDVNVLGMARVMNAFLPAMVDQGSGHLVTTGSSAGLFPYAYDRLPYAAAKGAVVAMTEALALYLRPRGIGVSCLCPAGVITNIGEHIHQYGPPTPVQAPQVPVVTAEEVAELVVEGILANRLLILSHPVEGDLVREHGADRQAFVERQLRIQLEGTS